MVESEGVQFVLKGSLHDSSRSREFFDLGEAEPGDGLDELLNCVFAFLLEVVVAVSDSVVEDI